MRSLSHYTHRRCKSWVAFALSQQELASAHGRTRQGSCPHVPEASNRAQRKRAILLGWPFSFALRCRRLVFGNLRDGAHGAFLEAFAAADASILVHDLSRAGGNFENLLRAGVDADAAAYAVVSVDNRMRHDVLLLVVRA